MLWFNNGDGDGGDGWRGSEWRRCPGAHLVGGLLLFHLLQIDIEYYPCTQMCNYGLHYSVIWLLVFVFYLVFVFSLVLVFSLVFIFFLVFVFSLVFVFFLVFVFEWAVHCGALNYPAIWWLFTGSSLSHCSLYVIEWHIEHLY